MNPNMPHSEFFNRLHAQMQEARHSVESGGKWRHEAYDHYIRKKLLEMEYSAMKIAEFLEALFPRDQKPESKTRKRLSKKG